MDCADQVPVSSVCISDFLLISVHQWADFSGWNAGSQSPSLPLAKSPSLQVSPSPFQSANPLLPPPGGPAARR